MFGPIHPTPEEFENEGFTLRTHQMFNVHTTPEEFENKGFTLKTHQMFSLHTSWEKFENAIITGHFGFVLRKTGGQGNQTITVMSSFSESSVFEMFFRPH